MNLKLKLIAIVVVVTIVCVGTFLSWYAGPDWTDQGKVNWIGQKQFIGNAITPYWNTPFSIQTLNHGIVNVTTAGFDGQCHGARTTTSTFDGMVTLGELFGVVHYVCGGYSLVQDP